ncbi:hypothetical protein QR680_015772 [Steinernema hermaphroditum]|uniref:BPTI/Kunitz inhibitor domain-containing protein n=1 Tax=Steinernema hermaphroditum TaxID=289476 RepID=A0AA39H960_9BILA|nr:hypothetical protein QR680_015772 [Steinernema hermaphroditum]
MNCLFVFVVLCTASCASAAATRKRPWNSFSYSLFLSRPTERLPLIIRKDVLPHSLPKIHPDCFEQLSPSYIYRSFSLPFFTFDAVQGKCMLIYGVGARHGTPNVFFSYESCAKSCCPNGC